MDLRQTREQIVREHMESENTHDFDVTLGTFADHPRYEIVPTGDVYDGREEVSTCFEDDRLVCERAYFDSAKILRQLGIAHDPLTLRGRVATVLNHPVTVGGALLRSLRDR